MTDKVEPEKKAQGEADAFKAALDLLPKEKP